MDANGLVYLLNQAGIALAEVTQRNAELAQQNAELTQRIQGLPQPATD